MSSSSHQPKLVTGKKLFPHQIEAVEWITHRVKDNQPPASAKGAILADEMGLGKTLTSISIIASLLEQQQQQPLSSSSSSCRSPFLVITPLSLLEEWMKELKSSAPTIIPLKYGGSGEAREVIRDQIVSDILALPKEERKNPSLPFHLFLTSYEIFINDVEFIRKFKWRMLIVDEAHRLKNPNSVLYTALYSMCRELEEKSKDRVVFRLLLTGTPVQNNLEELWSLLNFISPPSLLEVTDFVKVFKNDTVALRKYLQPLILRREKSQISSLTLPAKKEAVLKASLTSLQRKFYIGALKKEIDAITNSLNNQNFGAKNYKNSLSNVVISLRKACNHPYLFEGAEPEPFEEGDHLWKNCGKLSILHQLLPSLLSQNHKVLIFCQMTKMIDILQDFLTFLSIPYERLDGGVRGEERFLAIDRFQRGGAAAAAGGGGVEPLVFLLSTRAGGQGLNLTQADTVIFYDSDWNPQRDFQAQERVYRIGQTKDVLILRFVTENTIEEIMYKRAAEKSKLSKSVIGVEDANKENDPEMSKDDMLKLLTYGLSSLMKNKQKKDNNDNMTDDDVQEENEEDFTIPKADLDEILNRSTQKPKLVKNLTMQIGSFESPPSSPLPEEEKEKKKAKASAGAAAAASSSAEKKGFYVFEGQDYSLQNDDSEKVEKKKTKKKQGGGGKKKSVTFVVKGDKKSNKRKDESSYSSSSSEEESSDEDDLFDSDNEEEDQEALALLIAEEESERNNKKKNIAVMGKRGKLTRSRTQVGSYSLSEGEYEQEDEEEEETEEQKQARKEKRAAAAEKRRQRKEEKKREMWTENGYSSHSLPKPSEEEMEFLASLAANLEIDEELEEGGAAGDADNDDASSVDSLNLHDPDEENEKKKRRGGGASAAASASSHHKRAVTDDLQLLFGDASYPSTIWEENNNNNSEGADENVFVVHCVDDSGNWGRGGFFRALDSRFGKKPGESYEDAKENDDLVLGDVHLIPCKFLPSSSHSTPTPPSFVKFFVALVVAQTRSKSGNLSGVLPAALDMALPKLALAAVQQNASIHSPRIGASDPNSDWYAIQRLLKKHLASKGIPTFVYYFRRNNGGGGAAAAAASGSLSRQSSLTSPRQHQHQHQHQPSSSSSGAKSAMDVTSVVTHLAEQMIAANAQQESESENEYEEDNDSTRLIEGDDNDAMTEVDEEATTDLQQMVDDADATTTELPNLGKEEEEGEEKKRSEPDTGTEDNDQSSKKQRL